MKPNELPPQVQFMQFVTGKWISKPIYVAAKLGIADMLGDEPKSISELAKKTNSKEELLYRLMRVLASIGIFKEVYDKHFVITPMAECLRSEAMRAVALLFNSDWNDKAWMYLLDSVKTGDIAFDKAHGMSIMDWFKNNPEAVDIFSKANAWKAVNSHRAIVDVYDFTGITTITDVGGGIGALMTEILASNFSVEGIIAELPQVIKEANNLIKEKGIEERCKTSECDFLKEIPYGSDAYLLSHILHDWSDEKCNVILNNCYKAMKPGSKLLIIEMIIPSGNDFSIAKLLDLEMLVLSGGKERTESEYKQLLEKSGLKLNRIISTKESICIIEGIKVTTNP